MPRQRRIQRGDRDVHRDDFCAAIGAIRSRSRSTPADLVTSENACRHSASTSTTARVMSQPPLDRLVGIGGRAEVEHQRLVGALRQHLAQPLRGIHLGDDARLEVEAGREVEVAVRRPRKAIDAAVPAAAMGLMERSKPMSGESLPVMMDLARSSMICVRGASTSSPACWSSVPQPSSRLAVLRAEAMLERPGGAAFTDLGETASAGTMAMRRGVAHT